MKTNLISLMKQLCLTLFEKNLEFIGTFDFVVKEKKSKRTDPEDRNSLTNFVYVASKDGLYEGVATLPLEDYNNFQVNTLCELGVIRHKKRSDFFVLTANLNANIAVAEIVQGSRKVVLAIVVLIATLIIVKIAVM